MKSTWSGGETHQIRIAPEGAQYAKRDFLWRLSVATVAIPESEFTPLPDYMRVSAILSGGMVVSHEDGPRIKLQPYAPHAFDGGQKTRAWGECRDLNLMTRKGACQGSMQAIQLRTAGPIDMALKPGDTALLFAAKGPCTVAGAVGIIAIEEGACLWIAADAPATLTLSGKEGDILLASRVTS